MSADSAGGSRQGESGKQSFPEFDMLPETGDMSQLLGGAGDRITKALEEADEATKAIFERARREAREHNERALKEVERDTQERIEKMLQVTEEVDARAELLRRRARELADIMRQSTETLTGELGLADQAAATTQLEEGGGGTGPKPMTPDLDTEGGSQASKPPPALRELFGFKRKRFTDKPPSNDAAKVRALQMIVSGYGEKAER